jgi:large subunit ribosomal protein L18
MKSVSIKEQKRKRRHKRVRAQISGTAKRPRLSVFKSNRYIYAQLIDDDAGETLVESSSRNMKNTQSLKQAMEVGTELAKKAKKKKITDVVFDRGGFVYTGRLKAFAESAREGGLNF